MLCQPVRPKCSTCLCRFTCPSSTDKKPKKEKADEEEPVKEKKVKVEVKQEIKEEVEKEPEPLEPIVRKGKKKTISKKQQ